MEVVKKKSICRVCKSIDLQRVLSLGETPPANAFLKKDELSKPEQFFPLELDFCNQCSFVQLAHVVSPELLFKDYVYVSSTSPVFIAHFQELAKKICDRFELPKNSLIIDIGSNDGILLRPFKELGMRVLGVDPAKEIATRATEDGINTIPLFFTSAVAQEIVEKNGKAAVVSATSAFPHIDNLDEVVRGVRLLLQDDGIFLIEAYYLLDLLDKNLFDTIYHEHLSYFTVTTLSKLFQRLDMEIFDVEKTDTHGGSLRIFVQKKSGPHKIQVDTIKKFINMESEKGLTEVSMHIDFSDNIKKNKEELLKLLQDLKSSGKSIIGYGAPAKGNTLLNYFHIGNEVLDYIIDDSPQKQGLYTPGTHIPVVHSEELYKKEPDYVFILAWNFAEPIMKKLSWFSEKGGKFIVPVPTPRII